MGTDPAPHRRHGRSRNHRRRLPAEVPRTHTGKDGKGILITEPAMRQLAALMGAQGQDKVLRVGVRSGGCSGMSYTMDFIDAAAIRPTTRATTTNPRERPPSGSSAIPRACCTSTACSSISRAP